MSEERFDRLEQRLTEVKDSLSREMRTLYEKMSDDIKALALPVPELERRWRADDAVLREGIEQRLDPLEASVRKHFGT